MKTVTFDETQWKLVPVEPTRKMITAGMGADAHAINGAIAEVCWRNMLASAPQPTDTEGSDDG